MLFMPLNFLLFNAFRVLFVNGISNSILKFFKHHLFHIFSSGHQTQPVVNSKLYRWCLHLRQFAHD